MLYYKIMELVKKLGTELQSNKKWFTSFGLFLCPYCEKEVKKAIGVGKKQKSCGCYSGKLISLAKTKNGKDELNYKIYHVWYGFIQRCYNKKHKHFKHYGGRGIIVDNIWLLNYYSFKDWALSNGYKIGLTIDRINNNGNYEPNNCRFVTYAENSVNKRTTKLTKEQVEQIRQLRKEKVHYLKICKTFNISHKYFYHLTNGKGRLEF